jgi:type I restriction-modification system DNA methylase subunit
MSAARHDVQHDVMKVLHERIIDAEQRHRLGEYSTPDLPARVIVAVTVDEPLARRVLDPACGSGTFLSHALRHHLDPAGRRNRVAHRIRRRSAQCAGAFR